MWFKEAAFCLGHSTFSLIAMLKITILTDIFIDSRSFVMLRRTADFGKKLHERFL